MSETRAGKAQYHKIRQELSARLGFGENPDALPIDRSMRLDTIVGLKLALDEQRARQYRGEPIETAEMLRLAEALEQYLPKAPEPPVDDGDDPHENLMRIIEGWIEADKANKSDAYADAVAERAAVGLSAPMADLETAQNRIDELEARLAEFEPRALPSPAPEANAEAERVIDPPTSDIFGPREFADSDPGPRPGPDDHKVLRPRPVIDHEPAPQSESPSRLRPVPPQTVSSEEAARRRQAANARRVDPPPPRPAQQQSEPWRPYVSDGSGGDRGFFWGGRLGREW